MRRASRSLEQVTARGSTATAAELVSPAMIEAESAREALVCIVAEKIVAFWKDCYCYGCWLAVWY